MKLQATVVVHGKRMIATIDSGAMHTMISSRTIEKYKIPHRVKKTPIPVVLADDKPMDYGNGMI